MIDRWRKPNTLPEKGVASTHEYLGECTHIWQSRQSGSAEAELHIFGSQGRTKVRTRNFRPLAVKTERKCGNGTSSLWQSRQRRKVEVEFQIFSRRDRAEVRKQNCRSLTGSYPTDCHCQCWIITLLTAIMKDSVKTSVRRIGHLGSSVPAVFGRDVCLMSGSLSLVCWFDHAW